MKLTYHTQGTCSTAIEVEVVNGTVTYVNFAGGCNGNTQGVCRLVQGMRADEVINRLSGVKCRNRGTSCPDQLAQALRLALNHERDS